jgi:hypothetical protein
MSFDCLVVVIQNKIGCNLTILQPEPTWWKTLRISQIITAATIYKTNIWYKISKDKWKPCEETKTVKIRLNVIYVRYEHILKMFNCKILSKTTFNINTATYHLTKIYSNFVINEMKIVWQRNHRGFVKYLLNLTRVHMPKIFG